MHKAVKYLCLKEIEDISKKLENLKEFINEYNNESNDGNHVDIDQDLYNKIIEMDVLRWIIVCPSKLNNFNKILLKNFHADTLLNQECYKIFWAIYAQLQKDNKITVDILDIAMELDSEECIKILKELLGKRLDSENANFHFRKALQKILDRNWMNRRKEIGSLITNVETGHETATELMKEFDYLLKNPPKIIE